MLKAEIRTGFAVRSGVMCRGFSISSFTVWPTDSVLNLVGAVLATCTDGKNTSKLSLGFNSTDLQGNPSFCSNQTRAGKTTPLDNGSVKYRYSHKSNIHSDYLQDDCWESSHA